MFGLRKFLERRKQRKLERENRNTGCRDKRDFFQVQFVDRKTPTVENLFLAQVAQASQRSEVLAQQNANRADDVMESSRGSWRTGSDEVMSARSEGSYTTGSDSVMGGSSYSSSSDSSSSYSSSSSSSSDSGSSSSGGGGSD